MYQLLIVDEDARERASIREAAEADGMTVFEATGGKEGLEIIKTQEISIMVLDVTISDMVGFNLCRQVCQLKNTPILIYTTAGDEFIKLFAYNELGISDYVVKPCSPQEVIARLKVILRHRSKSSVMMNDDVFKVEGLLMYKQARSLFVDGERVELTPKEFDLLAYFVANVNHVLTREQILKAVWGYDFFGSDRTVDTHIKRLRDHLGKYRDYIVTTHRVGYRFEPRT